MLIISTTSLTLMDSAKQAGLVGCSGIYLSKLCSLAIFFKIENLGTYFIYIYIALVAFFILLLQCCMLLCLLPKGSSYFANGTRLGLFLS